MTAASLEHPARVVVVGTGPAGVRAAQALVAGRRCGPSSSTKAGATAARSTAASPRASSAPTPSSTAARPRRRRRCIATSMRCASSIDYRSDTLAWNLSEGDAARRARRRAADAALRRAAGLLRRHRPPDAGARLAARRLLQPGRRADRAEGAGLRDRLARRLPRQRAAALPGRVAVRAGRRAGRGGARHRAGRQVLGALCRAAARGRGSRCAGWR